MIHFLYTLTGLAIFLFSLRFLTVSIDESIANRVAPYIKHLNKGFLRPLVIGVLLTILFQASSITILATMAFVGRRLISLPTGIFLMFGATIGTSLKSWAFATDTQMIGYLLIIVPSFSLLFVKQHFRRRSFELLLAIGFMFHGWNIISEAAGPLSTSTHLAQIFEAIGHTPSLQTMLVMVLLSFLATVIVQSSSTVMILLIGMAQINDMPFLLGVAGVLGANIGTTVTELLVAMEYQAEVKRLALAHFLIKAIGAFMTLMLLKTFLNTLDLLFWGQLSHYDTAQKLSLVHIGFNLINVAIWLLLNNFLMLIIKKVVPSDAYHSGFWITDSVRNLLAQNSDQAMQEINEQWRYLKEKIKLLEDEVFGVLILGKHPSRTRDSEEIEKEFVAVEEILLSLLSSDSNNHDRIARMLADFRQLKLIFAEIVSLKGFLGSLSVSRLREVSQRIKRELTEINQQRHDLWFHIFLEEKAKKTNKIERDVLKNLENQILNTCKEHSRVDKTSLTLVYNLSSGLLRHLQSLLSLARQEQYNSWREATYLHDKGEGLVYQKQSNPSAI